MTTELSRRTILKQLTGVAAGVALVSGGGALLAPATAVAADTTWRQSYSANGWSISTDRASFTSDCDIQGTGLTVALREGDTATVLAYLAQRFHYDVAQLDSERGEIVGYRAHHEVRAEFESNHLSGTALALYPESFPLGATGNFYPYQVTVIRDILAELRGVVKWGGDMRPAMESMFYIDVPPESQQLKQVAATLREWQITPGEGAGTQNVEDPKRIKASKALTKRQKH
ncbi:hypothetical protein AB0K64_28510 [Streptomyces sp. NPDC053741]|jgi:hypothetical protein|uniref:hypothetical protein n=1 Tax=Streptomyces TaxID=1883 RepID=UPI0004BE2CF6|nr:MULTISPECIES: hypothetical protein [Streptomyces]MDX3181842.1 hypothetical protein [Streptomyces sp. ME02-7008A-1]MDX3302514.1 hypothetical protein [Streptomyces sp. ME02-7008A]QBR08260.1 hypothetical protein D7Y56_21420 [Streptomyces sp. S501]WSZ49928.1 hypothetical protein OG337_22375 [[Kitasatospora] papulosa]